MKIGDRVRIRKDSGWARHYAGIEFRVDAIEGEFLCLRALNYEPNAGRPSGLYHFYPDSLERIHGGSLFDLP